MRLTGPEGQLDVAIDTPWHADAQVRATGDAPDGKGARQPIPLHLVYEAHDVRVAPGQPLTWQMTLTLAPAAARAYRTLQN